MFWIIAFLIVGINFGQFIFPQLDIWHATGFFAQLVILIGYATSLFVRGYRVHVKNIPLGLTLLWIGIHTSFFCFITLTKGKYNSSQFFPFFNFLCLVIVYRIIVEHLDRGKINRILEFMRYVIIAQLLFCTLQYFQISQFFILIHPDNPFANNPVVGFMGNGTHLSGFLASTIPLFLYVGWNKRENALALILMFLILTKCGTDSRDIAVSGFLIGWGVVLYWIFSLYRKWFPLAVTISLAIAFFGYLHFEGTQFLNSNGRIGLWQQYWELFKQRPLTGAGLGTVNQLYKLAELPDARHLHLEYFHFAFEVGIIGLVLILSMIGDFFRIGTYSTQDDHLFVTLKSLVLGFLLSCLFNYPAHLWIPSIWALFAYASIYCLRNEDLRNRKYGN